jgi:hypothetical protein
MHMVGLPDGGMCGPTARGSTASSSRAAC